MKSAAHVPPGVPFESLIDSGLNSVEHSFYLVKAANPEDASLSRRMAENPLPTGVALTLGLLDALPELIPWPD